MTAPLSPEALDQLFNQARTHSHWLDKAVSDSTLFELYDLLKMGPTSANCCPARFVFVKSQDAKEKLKPCLAEGNVEKTMQAPVTAIVAHDMEFYEYLPELFPQTDARSWFAGKPKAIESNAFRNGSLQGAYLILAARSLGLDCGPMSGFSPAKVNEAFFEGTNWRANFLCNLGYGDDSRLYPRNPRLSFDQACRLL